MDQWETDVVITGHGAFRSEVAIIVNAQLENLL
jgi:hypothetical protein